MPPTGRIITHERDLLDRDRWLTEHPPSPEGARDCIIFTHTTTDPGDRMSTRIGGLPYWPRALEWPHCSICAEPLSFIGQLDFHCSPQVGIPENRPGHE